MKAAVLPRVCIEPEPRADLQLIVRDGEALSEFVESTALSAVEFQRLKGEFQTRADAAWEHFQRTGEARPAYEVIARLRGNLVARRSELRGRRRELRRRPLG